MNRKKGIRTAFLSKGLIRKTGTPVIAQTLRNTKYFTGRLETSQRSSALNSFRKAAKLLRRARPHDKKGFGPQRFWLSSNRPKRFIGRLRPISSVFQPLAGNRKQTPATRALHQMMRSINFFRKNLEFMLIEKSRSPAARKAFKGVHVMR